MYRLLVVFSTLALSESVIALSDVNKQCIQDNSDIWSNDNLIGSWFKIWHFTLFGGYVPTAQCPERRFSRPTEDILQQYKNKYNDASLPYNLDDNALLVDEGMVVDGLITGHNVAKFFVLSPNSTLGLNLDGYIVDAYKQLTPKFIMYTECRFRGHIRWLLSNDKNATVSEIEELIKITPELNHLEGQRFCA